MNKMKGQKDKMNTKIEKLRDQSYRSVSKQKDYKFQFEKCLKELKE